MQRIINKKVVQILKNHNINVQDGLAYLLILHYNLKPTFIPRQLMSNVQTAKIVEKALDKTGLKWFVPLFEGEETAFEWVKNEYIPLFKAKNATKGGRVRECTARMKKFFSENPEWRKEDVLGATEMYINTTGAQFIMDPHYFITKGTGASKTERILTELERYKELQGVSNGESRTSHSNTMSN